MPLGEGSPRFELNVLLLYCFELLLEAAPTWSNPGFDFYESDFLFCCNCKLNGAGTGKAPAFGFIPKLVYIGDGYEVGIAKFDDVVDITS